jgi:peroxin-4
VSYFRTICILKYVWVESILVGLSSHCSVDRWLSLVVVLSSPPFVVYDSLSYNPPRPISNPRVIHNAMATLTLAASKRLRKELQVLRKSQAADPEDDILLQHNSENLLLWKAWLKGPTETPYEGGVFQLDIRCGVDYPLSPPTIKFVTRVFHPNVHFRTGDICLDILKKEWSPAWGLQAACRAVLALVRAVVLEWRVCAYVLSCVFVCVVSAVSAVLS